MINVVAAILENDKREILIAKRKKDKILGGFWEFPGGKVEEGETPEVGLIRELKEEMNIDIEVIEYIGESIHHYERGSINLIAFKAKIVGGNITLVDHEEYAWVEVDKLNDYKLAPADIPIVNLLKLNSRSNKS